MAAPFPIYVLNLKRRLPQYASAYKSSTSLPLDRKIYAQCIRATFKAGKRLGFVKLDVW